MKNNSFTYGGREFQLRKIDAFKQFHIVRRIGPILSDLLPAIKDIGGQAGLKDLEKLTEEQKLDSVAKLASPVMTGLSKLSDADSELVLFGLLSSVEVKQPAGNWASVATNSMLMMQDLDLPALLHLAGRAFVFNLSSFFAGLPQ